MKLKKLAQAMALIGVCSHVCIPAFAQGSDLQRVEVTGSSIKRLAGEGALPLEIINLEQMKQRGINSAEDLLRQLGANAAGSDNAVSSNSVFSAEADRLGGGGSYANLRGIGPTGTLVLLNGRRLSNQGLSGGSVDLNAIPFEMIQRVEILKDGASAIYGTDAIGGVINFILRDDFQGASASVNVSKPTASGGGMRRKVALSGGFGQLAVQGFNVMASISADKNDILRGKDRDFATGYRPDLFAVPDTTSSPYFANIIGQANSALPTAGTTVNGGGTTKYTVLNRLALTNQCDAVPFGVSQAQNPNIIPGLGYTVANSTYRCGTDYGRQFMMTAPTENVSAVLRGKMVLNATTTAFAEFVGSRVETRGEFVPGQFSTTSAPSSINATTNPALATAFSAAGLSSTYTNGATTALNTSIANYPVNGPYYQNMQALFGAAQFDPTKPIAYRLRMADWGYRTVGNVSTNKRFAFGVEGELAGYDYKASLSRGEAEGYTKLIDGYADINKLVALLASGKYNPFLLPGQTQTAEAIAAVAATKVTGRIQGGKTRVDEFNATVSGRLMSLPAGSLDFALGVNARSEFYGFTGTQTYNCVGSFTAANLALSNSTLLCAGNAAAPDSTRKVEAVFGELQVPVVKNLLELQIAARYDHYSEIGGTSNPKVAFKLTPMKELLFRGSYNTGFRAPTAQQLKLGRVELTSGGSNEIVDPLKCPNPVGNADPSCHLLNIPVFSGGNANLKPETSRQATLGMVFAPFDSLSLSADYWQIKLADRIHLLTFRQELDNYALFSNNFERNADGTLKSIQAGWINAGRTEVKGVDLTLLHNMNLGGGKLSTSLSATKMISAKDQTLASTPLIQTVGQWTVGTLYLPWKGNVTSNYKIANWSTALSLNYQSSYQDEDRTPYVGTNPAGTPVRRKVSGQLTANLFTSFTGIKNLTLTAGVINLFDHQPPFTWHDPDFALGAGWDARTSDPRGRTVQLGAKYNF